MKQDFKYKLINKIKQENIKPLSKKYFIIRTILINLFFIFSILIWALAIAIIFWYLFEADWYLTHKIWLIKITITFLPVFWLIFLLLSTLLSYYNFKRTEIGYRFYLWQIILINVIFSFIIWILFYFSGFSQYVEEKIQKKLPEYSKYIVLDKNSRMKQIWQNEDKWLLLWLIVKKLNNNNYLLKDTNNKIWKLKITNKTIIRHNLILQSWLKIKLIWKKTWENSFEVLEIRPFIWNWKWFEENHYKNN